MNLPSSFPKSRRALLQESSSLVLVTALCGGGGAWLTENAGAAVVMTPGISEENPLLIPVSFEGVYLNIVTGATGSSSAVAGWDLNPYSNTNLSVYLPSSNSGVVQWATGPANLPVGEVVGASSTFSGGGVAGAAVFGSNAGEWKINETNYIGFRFFNESTGQVHYGYAAVQIGASDTDSARRFIGIFYEDQPGQSITVTAVPEPASALLATGALGLLAFRRRRQSA